MVGVVIRGHAAAPYIHRAGPCIQEAATNCNRSRRDGRGSEMGWVPPPESGREHCHASRRTCLDSLPCVDSRTRENGGGNPPETEQFALEAQIRPARNAPVSPKKDRGGHVDRGAKIAFSSEGIAQCRKQPSWRRVERCACVSAGGPRAFTPSGCGTTRAIARRVRHRMDSGSLPCATSHVKPPSPPPGFAVTACTSRSPRRARRSTTTSDGCCGRPTIGLVPRPRDGRRRQSKPGTGVRCQRFRVRISMRSVPRPPYCATGWKTWSATVSAGCGTVRQSIAPCWKWWTFSATYAKRTTGATSRCARK